MNSLLGTGALSLGFVTSVGATGWWVLAAHRARPSRPARQLTTVMLASAALACGVLVWALVTHDFSVRYVADNGARAVPLYYTVISLWAALEGSLLLWLLVLAGYAVLVMRHVHPRAAALHPWAMAVLCAVAVFFFGLALFAGNAFEPVSPVPADGPGPNPLLQDHPLMGIHPPMLYLGYVGLTVPFAYAVAALITGRTGRGWLIVTRRWTLAAWTFLTGGIMLGGWWSYEVLGWGGYWAWDPVENASILPWFTATALIHSVMVQERRATLRVWNLSLAVATFLLVLLGTFLTRSGVVASVHAFTQSAIGPLLLAFLILVFIAVMGLLIWRADRLGPEERVETGLSREAVFLGNNVILVGLAFTVMIGTVFPLLVEAVNGQRVSVGAPYFNRMAIPLALAMLVLMGIGPLVQWGVADLSALGRRLVLPSVAGLLTVAAMGLSGLRGVAPLLTIGLGVFVLGTILDRVATGWRATRSATGARALPALVTTLARRRRLYGGLLVHTGVVMAAIAIAASSSYSIEGQDTLDVGESFRVGRYTATLEAITPERTDRKMQISAQVAIADGDRDLGVYEPALSFYPANSQAIGTPSVRTRLTEDAYLLLTSVDDDRTTATIRLIVSPLVVWLWISAGVMVVGAAVAGWPARTATEPPGQVRAGRERHEVGT
jgi:cytochrome c-type biogenesis protein CcmF